MLKYPYKIICNGEAIRCLRSFKMLWIHAAVLKDADVIHHVMNDISKDIKEKEKARYVKLCEEFRM